MLIIKVYRWVIEAWAFLAIFREIDSWCIKLIIPKMKINTGGIKI